MAGRQTSWRQLTADPTTGYLTDVSEKQYRPSAHLDRSVRARDLTCRFPGCRHSAVGAANGTDIDHTVPWPEGPTTAANLVVLCRRHHRLKQTDGWRVEPSDDGSLVWTTPAGHQATSWPWRYLDPEPPDPLPQPLE